MPLPSSPEVQPNPDPDSTTTGSPADNPQQISSPHQIRLALFERIGHFRKAPPDRALWREATILVIQTVDLGRLRVSRLILQHVMWGLYFLADAAGHVSGYTEQQLAVAMCCSRREVQRVLRVVNGIAVRCVRKNRRSAVEYHLNLGGMDWPTIRRRAALHRQPQPVTDGTQPLKLDLVAPASSGVPGTPLDQPRAASGVPGTPPKGYYVGLRTSTAVAAEYRGGDPGTTEHLDRQQQRELPPPTTTPPTTPPTEEEPDAGTRDTIGEREQRRFEGLMAAIAALTRASGGVFSAEDERELRQQFVDGQLSLGDLQRRADRLKASIAGRAAVPRPVRRRHYGERPDLSDAEYVVWEASGRNPAAVERYRTQAEADEADEDLDDEQEER